MKIALCYDRVNKFGGAERVLQALHELWPDAPLYTLTYDREGATWAQGWDVRSSFLEKIPLIGKKHELFPPLAPIAWEQFNFNEFDVVVSVTSAEAKAIVTSPNTLHICYCLTPTRYYWSGYYEYVSRPGLGFLNKLVKFIFPFFAYILRVWDFYHAQRPDVMVGISDEVCRRIKTYYNRDSIKIYPPVDALAAAQFNEQVLASQGNYFLVVSRLVPYKKVDIVIDAFNELGWPLKIVGVGSEMENLRMRAKQNVEFVGYASDEKIAELYKGCIAVIFAPHEDFGIVPVEAQLYGKPVVAYKGGGALETVVEGKTGVFFEEQTGNSIVKKLSEVCRQDVMFDEVRDYFARFKSEDCMKNAELFSKGQFQKTISSLVDKR